MADILKDAIIYSILILMAFMMCSCTGAFAPRADPGTATMYRYEYDKTGDITSSTRVNVTNDEDSKEGFSVSLDKEGARAGTSGSKDAVQTKNTSAFFWLTVMGSISIVIGAVTLLSRTLGNFIPSLSFIPRSGSWLLILTGIGLVCAKWMGVLVGGIVVLGIIGAVFFLGLQSNVQVNRKHKPKPRKRATK